MNFAELKVNHLLEMAEELKNEVSNLNSHEIQETARASYAVSRKLVTASSTVISYIISNSKLHDAYSFLQSSKH